MLLKLLFLIYSNNSCNQTVNRDVVLDVRDGNVYTAVKIGNQKWLSQNLNYDIPNNSNDWCLFSNSDSCKFMGRHYDFNSANMKVCPKGYHLPNKKDFDMLYKSSGDEISGINLKARSGFPKYYDMTVNGIDKYGFCALPNTRRDPYGQTHNFGNEYYWTSDSENGNGIRYLIGHGAYDLSVGPDPKGNGYSVRCVNDTLFYDEKPISSKKDTVFVDTVYKYIVDTIVKEKVQQIFVDKAIFDTIYINKFIRTIDTIFMTDTIYIRDTITTSEYKKLDGYYEENLYNSKTTIRQDNQFSVYEYLNDDSHNTSDNYNIKNLSTIKIKSNKRFKLDVIVYDNSGVFVNNFSYNKDVDDDKILYITFNGKDKNDNYVTNGIYILKVFTNSYDNKRISLYKVGVNFK